jgi:hypothetical protein
MNLPSGVEFDWMLRGVSALDSQRVPAYTTSDIRIGRALGKAMTLALVGRDLHAPHHAEFATGGTVFYVRRTVQASINWRW